MGNLVSTQGQQHTGDLWSRSSVTQVLAGVLVRGRVSHALALMVLLARGMLAGALHAPLWAGQAFRWFGSIQEETLGSVAITPGGSVPYGSQWGRGESAPVRSEAGSRNAPSFPSRGEGTCWRVLLLVASDRK